MLVGAAKPFKEMREALFCKNSNEFLGFVTSRKTIFMKIGYLEDSDRNKYFSDVENVISLNDFYSYSFMWKMIKISLLRVLMETDFCWKL